MIRRLIIESQNGYTLVNNPLTEPITEDTLRRQFKEARLPLWSVAIDSVGTALVTVAQSWWP